ncbi:9766_t:CDS:2, partial [Funneliformis mosseae]
MTDNKPECLETKTTEPGSKDYEKIQEMLKNDKKLVPQFWVNKYKNEASRNWDLFYKRNTTKFFKNRHWIGREFNELSFNNNDDQDSKSRDKRIDVLELGCGVGNFIFPVLDANPLLFVYACDFSKRAIDFVKSHAQYDETRCNAFVCDLTKDNLSDFIPSNDNIDIVSSIFVLSSIPPEKHLD